MGKSFLVLVTNDLNQDQRMHRICDSLINNDHKVLLLGRKKKNSLPLLHHSFDQKRLGCWFSKGVLFYLEYNIRILFFALKFKPDAIYSVDLDTLLGGGLAARLLGSTLVHDAHEYFVEVPELYGKTIKKWIWDKVGKWFIPGADLCITVNEELAEILSDRYNSKFEVIRSVPSIQKKYDCATVENKIPVVLYQGVLNEGRGLEEAIEAIVGMNRKVELRIAGEGDLSHKLRQKVKSLQGEDSVVFLGWLTPEELKRETSQADIGLNLLSATSLNYRYSLANKFFDYMHAEVPSINMDFPVYRRITNLYEVGLCIDSLERETIREAIESILNNSTRILEIKEACRKAKLVYNWEKEEKRLIRLIDNLV